MLGSTGIAEYRNRSLADTHLPWRSSRVPQAPLCHLGFQNANCPLGKWLIGQVATGRSCTQFAPATARGDDGNRSNRCGSRPCFRHRRATSWPACWLVTMSLPRMTVVTARRFPIHRFAARNRWHPQHQRIKYVTVRRDARPQQPLATPASVSPLTVSGLAHPGSGGSLLHSFASPKRQRLCRYDRHRPGRTAGAFGRTSGGR